MVEGDRGEDVIGMKEGGGGPVEGSAGKADKKKKDRKKNLPVPSSSKEKGKKKKQGGRSVSPTSTSTSTSGGRDGLDDSSRKAKKVKFG